MKKLCFLFIFLIVMASIIPMVNADAWVSPTGHESTSWVNPQNTYDDNIGTLSICFGSYTLVLMHNALTCSKVRFQCGGMFGNEVFKVEVYKNGAWEQVYNGIGDKNNFVEASFSEGSVTKMRFTPNPYVRPLNLYEADFWEVEAPAEQEYSFTFSETMNISSSLYLWKALMFSSTETVSTSTDSWFWKEKIVSFLESSSATDILSVLKEKFLAFVEFFETVNPTSEAFFIFPSVNISILFVGLMLVLGVLAFVGYLDYKKKKRS